MEDDMRTTDQLRAAILGAMLGLPLTMCGGAASMPPASPAPAQEVPAGAAAPPATYPEAQPGYPQQLQSPPPPPGQPSAPAPGDAADVARRREAARTELGQAQRDLEAAASDCSAACRALASMERATLHLCELAADPDDRGRCDDARQRLHTARERIRSACGTCP
jgi:hypothetical protein